ncbi:MAG: hypothetical protein AAF682_28640 [Planctomycetota bacterium]
MQGAVEESAPPGGAAEDALPPVWPAALLCLLFGCWTASLVDAGRSYGWDESMHAQLPAVRMALAVRAGEAREAVEVALGCHQYPFVAPVLRRRWSLHLLLQVLSVVGLSLGTARLLQS